ncbi:MAG: SpoIIE family protein phosphatase [Bryobacteraceae bacterium]|jgi:serine phosphatase RsbU (regulator of sigma subunit)/catechol 2,3-dioxygenase-like lactoylglutathione lyase family enzyme
MDGSRNPYLAIRAINVFVRDQERSVRFFVDQLGFRLAYDVRIQSGVRWVAVTPPDGTTVLSLIAPKPGTVQYKLIGRATQVVFFTDDVPATFREWNRRGVRFSQSPRLRRVRFEALAAPGDETAVWGGVSARFKDIDGNSFALASFDAMTRAVEAQRRAAAEKLEQERRAAQELEIAKQVQARLFPQTLPALETLEYAGTCIQARQVGGDYYDFLDLGGRRVGLVVGDIAGKGMAAALLMANLQANLRSQCAIALDQPRRFLQSVNRLFFENSTDSAYATLFFAEYDDADRRLRYANCGHLCALLLRRDGEIERLDSTGTVLGLFEQWDCSIGERRLSPGDTLALYTDGITESFDDAGEEFGEQRLTEALRRHCELLPTDLLAAIVDEVRRFSPGEQHDDITLIVARCKE